MFEPLNPEETIPHREEKVLQFWQEHNTFLLSISQREGSSLFSFYDGPPFATGLPHYGHLLAGTIKDVIPRYKTMKGYCVPRRFGWDCHGLPVENEIEKAKGLSGAASIEEFGVAKFNEECRQIVLRYTEEWKETVLRMGRWVDFEKTYRTMDTSFMESVWWVFKRLYEMGLVYQGYRVMPVSAKLGTTLSNFEAGENYQEIDDPSLFVACTVIGSVNIYLLVWTTTPWTLISNLAITAGPDLEYVQIYDVQTEKRYILAKERLQHVFKDLAKVHIEKTMLGKELAGMQYEPLFPHFAAMREQGAFRVIVDSFVTLDDGTGLVHTAPGFGESDFFACEKAGIPVVCPVDQNGLFTQEVSEFAGRFVKDCDKEIIRLLKQQGAVLRHETIRHRYPFCWRSDTPLIYKAVSTWFVAVEKIKEKLLRANEQIYWMPEHIKYGRFGKWLEAARDWNISRSRYWGTPIPLWRSDDGDIIVVGSISELETLTKSACHDLHRHFIDQLTIEHNGKLYRRIPEVFDCWFESGSMPYAQNHYPFEKSNFEETFPADFIAEGLDQTRGWFYTLTILAAALFDKPAFKNVIVNGIILAHDGSKMSKRLRNYPDPLDMVNKYGADAVRLYMLHSPVVKAEDFCFSEQGIELVLRQILLPFWNAYSFFITYAHIYRFKPAAHDAVFEPQATIDQWIISLLQKLIYDVEHALDRYDLMHAVEPFISFIEELTNWYIRRSRRRFWSDEATQDRHDAFQTLYTVLFELTKIAAPFVPFISEAIYRNMRQHSDPESVHLSDYPQYRQELRNALQEEIMKEVQQAVSLGHALRKEHHLKVRQPLPCAHIISREQHILDLLQKEAHLIADELNVQKVLFSRNESEFVTLKAKPNFRVLGKKVGKRMRACQEQIGQLEEADLQVFLEKKELTIHISGESIVLTSEDVAVERVVKENTVALNSDHMTVALDLTLTPELITLGLAREIVNKINLMRKEAGFGISDRIHVVMATTDPVKECIEQHQKWIASEILALSFRYEPTVEGIAIDLNGEAAIIHLDRVVATH